MAGPRLKSRFTSFLPGKEVSSFMYLSQNSLIPLAYAYIRTTLTWFSLFTMWVLRINPRWCGWRFLISTCICWTILFPDPQPYFPEGLNLPDVFPSGCGCWLPIVAGWSPCVFIGAAEWIPCVPIGAGWIPDVPMGAGWIPCVLMGAGWIPWICRACEASTVISCMGFKCTVDATPTPVWAVMVEFGAWAETGKKKKSRRSALVRTVYTQRYRKVNTVSSSCKS